MILMCVNMPVYAANKKVFHDYEILEKIEAGISLLGSEVKSVRGGAISLKGSFITIHDGEAYLTGATISQYKSAGSRGHQADRSRKLLLRKAELRKLIGKKQEQGLTIVPLSVYTGAKGKIKVEIAIARGKKQFDKRETIKRREIERRLRQAML